MRKYPAEGRCTVMLTCEELAAILAMLCWQESQLRDMLVHWRRDGARRIATLQDTLTWRQTKRLPSSEAKCPAAPWRQGKLRHNGLMASSCDRCRDIIRICPNRRLPTHQGVSHYQSLPTIFARRCCSRLSSSQSISRTCAFNTAKYVDWVS